jgi:hypothetical protein
MLANVAGAQALSTGAAKCRLAIAKGTRSVTSYVLAQMVTCEKKRVKGSIAASVNCADLTDAGFPASAVTKINTLATKYSKSAVTACAISTTTGLGYVACGSPCDAAVPVIATFADVSSCVTCLAKAGAASGILTTYGASPSTLLSGTTAWSCQNRRVAQALRTYTKSRMVWQRSCQYSEDTGKIGATDCKTADIKGKIASALNTANKGIGKCDDAELGALTSCSATIAGEQLCIADTVETLSDSLFDAIFPQPPATATPTVTPSPTITATPTATPTGGSCPSSSFLNVSGAAGPGGSYSSLHPSLSVACSSTTVTVQSNGIPTYQYIAMTPNGLQAKSYTFNFPRSPSVAASTTAVPLLGNVGVSVNGIPIYGVNEGPQPTSDAYGDPIAAAILDQCGSHSAQQGTFHYHKLLVKCLIQSAVSSSQPWNNADPSSSQASPIIGYAFDGFPIYGPYECTDIGCTSVQEMLSSWDNTGYQAGTAGCTSSAACSSGYCTDVMINGAQTTACVPKTCVWSNNTYTSKAGLEYLDRCNGHFGPNGDYHYHTTSAFPYILGCYRGTATSNGGNGTPPGGTCP